MGGGLRAYVLTRLVLTVPMLFVLLTVVFVLLHVAPGDPVLAIAPPAAPQATIDALRHQLGLDKPLWQQYLDYMSGVLRLDLGASLIYRGQQVTDRIAATFPATLELTLAATALAIVVGVGVGALAGARRGSRLDVGARLFGIVVYSMPVFWLGILLILLFSTTLHWLPSGGRGLSPLDAQGHPADYTGMNTLDSLLALDTQALADNALHLLLPAATLGLVIAGVFVRITRVNMLRTMTSDYVEAARARGVPERQVILNHALRNALIPVVTVVGLTFALLLSGAVLTENVYNWPGLARELTRALGNRDYPVVQGITAFFALIVVAVSLLIDVVNALIDPRVRY
jgi:peptide/nickel transport system permease protein